VKGDLRDFRLHDLVRICCQHSDDVRLRVERDGAAGAVYFSGAGIVHAEGPKGTGKAALFDLLEWRSGTFELEKGAAPPVRSIDAPWSALLAEEQELVALSRRRLGEAAPAPPPAPGTAGPFPALPGGSESPLDELVGRVAGLAGVREALLTGVNGEVLSHVGEGDPERLAAITAFVGQAASGIGLPLDLGEPGRSVVSLDGHRVVVARFGHGFVGLRLGGDAAVDVVCSEVKFLLGAA
jgi:hypothetical protein